MLPYGRQLCRFRSLFRGLRHETKLPKNENLSVMINLQEAYGSDAAGFQEYSEYIQ